MKTIIFSNIVGDVFANKKVSFLPKMKEIIKSWNLKDFNLVYVEATMKGYDDEIVFKNIIKCFDDVGLSFNQVVRLGLETEKVKILKKNVLYFLTGGDPLEQKKIIEKFGLESVLKKTEYAIGFCAGGINLSKYGIITSDEDFAEPLTYKAVERVDFSIEPHFNYEEQQKNSPVTYKKRMKELKSFIKKLNEPIVAIPDKSCIYVDDNETTYFGEIKILK